MAGSRGLARVRAKGTRSGVLAGPPLLPGQPFPCPSPLLRSACVLNGVFALLTALILYVFEKWTCYLSSSVISKMKNKPSALSSWAEKEKSLLFPRWFLMTQILLALRVILSQQTRPESTRRPRTEMYFTGPELKDLSHTGKQGRHRYK